MVRRAFPRQPLPLWQGLLLAVGLVVCAWLLRSGLDPVLREQMPYTLFLMAVLVASIFGGWRAGAVAAALSAFTANFSFVDPRGVLFLESVFGWGFAIFSLVAAVQVSLVHALADTLRRETTTREELATVSSEYRHRIKNLLTVTQSLVDQTARTSDSISEFKGKVSDRLHALARAQDLLQTGKFQGAPLGNLIADILAPFQVGERLTTSGPDVAISTEMTTPLALLLNELATNAVKYGALSVPRGRLGISWTVAGEWIAVEWKEMDGPHVPPPEKLGFGTRLFDKALPRNSGTTELFFEPDGVREIRLRTSAA